MIIDEVFKYCPENKALSFGRETLTYGQLQYLIKLRAQDLDKRSSVLTIRHSDPIKYIIDFLAALYIGRKVVLGNSESKKVDDQDEVLDWNINLIETTDLLRVDRKPDQFSFGVLSSGSSGEPHVIWKKNDEWESAFHHQSSVFNIKESNRLLVLDALSYSANLNAAVHTLWNGGEVCFTSLKSASSWNEEIRSRNIDSIFLVPSHWKLFASQKGNFYNVSSCVSAGEKLDSSTCRQIMKLFTNATITEYYGATELGHITYQQNQDIIEYPLSVGTAFPGVKLKVLEQKIHVESPYVSSAFSEHGTVNDLGYIEGGRLVLLGREGRMFNKRGLNVYAQEIESVALSHVGISASVLVKTQSDKLCLLYKLSSSNKHITKVELWSFLEERLAKSKHPHFLQEIDYLPLTQSGKIDYQELQQSYESLKLMALA